MSVRRVVLVLSLAAWTGMLGMLGFRRHAGAEQGEGGPIEALFSPQVPVLESKSLWLREDVTGIERRVGFFETQLTKVGYSDVHIRHTVEAVAGQVPPLAAMTARGLIAQLTGEERELQDFTGQVDVYVNRLRGLRRLAVRASYGPDRLEVWGQPSGQSSLRVVVRWENQDHTSMVPCDRRNPLGAGRSPYAGLRGLEVGQSRRLSLFDPLTRTATDRLIRVTGRAKVRYRGQDVECFVLTAHPAAADRGGDGSGSFGPPLSTAWISAAGGQVLREETRLLFFTLSVVLEDSVTAEERDYRKIMESPLQGAGTGGPGGSGGGPARTEGQGGGD